MPQIKIERAWWRPAAVISSAAVAIALSTVPKVALADETAAQTDGESIKREQVIGTADAGIASDSSVAISAPVANGGITDVGGASGSNEDSSSSSVTDGFGEGVVEAPTGPSEDMIEQDGSNQEAPEDGASAEDGDSNANDGGSSNSSEVTDVDGDAADNIEGGTGAIEDDVEGDAVDNTADGGSELSDEFEDMANGSNSTTNNALGSESLPEAPITENSVDSEQTIEDGTYAIGSALDSTKVFDTPNGQAVDGNGLQIYQGHGGSSQKWEVKWHDEDGGYYTIGLAGSNKVLDVQWGEAYEGAPVWLYEYNGSVAQRWSIKQEGGLWTILSHLGNFCLDVQWASTSNGTAVWLYSANGTSSQHFNFMKYYPEMPGEKYELEQGDGIYIIGSAGDPSGDMVLDVNGASFDNSANVQIYTNNNSMAQGFYFERDADGFYTITNLASGKALELASGGIVPSTNVQQYTSNHTDAQKWAIIRESSSDGRVFYYLVNKLTGLALDVKWAEYSNYTNVWGYTFDRSAAQRWSLTKVDGLTDYLTDGGIYVVHSAADANSVFDIESASSQDGAKLQVYASNGTLAQRFQIEIIGNNEFRIRTAASGGWLTVSDGNMVVQSGKGDDGARPENTWKAVWKNGFFSLVSGWTDASSTQYVLTISNGRIVVAAADSKLADSQHFLFRSAQLISDGYYEIASGLGNNLTLDVAGGTLASGSNIQIYTSNGTNAQKFHIVWNGSGYVITAARSEYAVEGKWGGMTNETNVWIYEANGTTGQTWKAEIADGGGIIFKNALSGLALDVQWATASSGTNVWLYEANGTASQIWNLVATTIPYGWVQESGTWKYYDRNGNMLTDSIVAYNLYQQIKDQYSDTNYLIAVDAVQCHVVLFQGSAGNWELVFDALAGTGDPYLASTDTDGYGVTGEGGNPWGSLRGYFKLGSTTTGYTDSDGRREYDSADQLKWFRSIYMDYGFHSTCGNYSDPSQVGKRISHGCIRLLEQYAKMIYDLPKYTMVAVLPSYNGSFQVDQR